MHLTRHITRSHLRLLGIAAGAVLLATPTIRAQATNCATVRAVGMKMLSVPYHLYLVDSGGAQAALNGGKPTVGEVISAGGSMYVLSHGKWVKSPVSLAEMKAQQNNADSMKTTCTHLRDESVNGEPAAVWRSHTVNEVATIDTDMWISKRSGLLLKSTSITDVGGGPMGKTRHTGRYDYTNVRVPAGVQ